MEYSNFLEFLGIKFESNQCQNRLCPQNLTLKSFETHCQAEYSTIFGGNTTITWSGLPVKSTNSTIGNVTETLYDYERCSLYNTPNDSILQISNLINATINPQSPGSGCSDAYAKIEQLAEHENVTPATEWWYAPAKSGMIKTATTEFNLVCEQESYVALIKSSYMVGFALGAMIFGGLADNKGRKWVMQICSVGAFLFDVAIVFSVLVSYLNNRPHQC